jgi:hypothetical protein
VAVSNIAKAKLASGDLDLGSADVRALLLDNTQATDVDRDFVDDLTGELTGTGYARKALANLDVTRDDANDRVVFTADPIEWEEIDAGAVDRLALYVHVTDDTDSWILSYSSVRASSGGVITTNGGDLRVLPDATLGFVRVA